MFNQFKFTTLGSKSNKNENRDHSSHDDLISRLQNYLPIFFNTPMISLPWTKLSSHYSVTQQEWKLTSAIVPGVFSPVHSNHSQVSPADGDSDCFKII